MRNTKTYRLISAPCWRFSRCCFWARQSPPRRATSTRHLESAGRSLTGRVASLALVDRSQSIKGSKRVRLRTGKKRCSVWRKQNQSPSFRKALLKRQRKSRLTHQTNFNLVPALADNDDCPVSAVATSCFGRSDTDGMDFYPFVMSAAFGILSLLLIKLEIC